jgi:hypothetical protein
MKSVDQDSILAGYSHLMQSWNVFTKVANLMVTLFTFLIGTIKWAVIFTLFCAVEVLVTRDGAVHEVKRQEIYRGYSCFDFGALTLDEN